MYLNYSKEFKQDFLYGKWKGYDEFGNLVSINLYENGKIVQSFPVVPEDAEYITDLDTLYTKIKSPDQSTYFCLDGNFFLEK